MASCKFEFVFIYFTPVLVNIFIFIVLSWLYKLFLSIWITRAIKNKER